MLEAAIQAKILKWIKSEGGFGCKMRADAYSGVPDLFTCLNGVVWLLEVKREDGKTSKIQEAVHRKIKRASGNVAVVRSLAEVKEIFNSPH